MRFWRIVINITLLAGLAFAQAQANFDAEQNTWILSNGWIRASFQLTPEGYFLTQQISDLQSGDQWAASPNRPTSPVRLQTDRDRKSVVQGKSVDLGGRRVINKHRPT